MKITTVGIDLAKNVIVVHGVDERGKAVPKQHSSGGKQVLLGISKRGDTYLRTLLIHGARAVIRVAERKVGYAQSWLAQLMGRRDKNVAAVAPANKNARIVWALLAHGRNYQPDYEPVAP